MLNLCYEGSNDAGLISGLIVGVLVCIGIAAALIILVMRRRNYIRKDKVSVFIYAMHESFEMYNPILQYLNNDSPMLRKHQACPFIFTHSKCIILIILSFIFGIGE